MRAGRAHEHEREMPDGTVIQIRGNFDDGMRIVKEMADAGPIAIVNSINPYRLQGQKTAAFEIVEALGRAPDYHCLPVGNAGNITAHWMGYSEYLKAGLANTRPKMIGYQAAGSAPFMRGHMVDKPETIATAIRIGHPQSWDKAWNVQKESGGWFDELSDDEILQTQRLLAQHVHDADRVRTGGANRGRSPGQAFHLWLQAVPVHEDEFAGEDPRRHSARRAAARSPAAASPLAPRRVSHLPSVRAAGNPG